LIFRPTTTFFADVLDFRLNIAIFQRNFFFFRGTFSFFSGGFDDPLKNLIFARKFKSSPETLGAPAEDLNFQRQI